jgi:hypothetical protein
VTNSTTFTFSSLQSGRSHYFAVTAVGRSGVESDFSEELVLYVPPAISVNTNAVSVQESASATFQVRLDSQPVGVTTVRIDRASGGSRYLGIVSGSTLVFSSANWSNYQTVTVAALYDPIKTNRTAVFECSGAAFSSATLHASSVGVGQSATASADASDADMSGIPDAWEITQFGGNGVQGAGAGDDPDHDGVPNSQEYTAGTDPNDPVSRPLIDTRVTAGGVEVSFLTIEATGAGYLGRSRLYTLERCTSLAQGVWEGVTSATDLPGQNQTLAYLEPASAMNGSTYRVRIELH